MTWWNVRYLTLNVTFFYECKSNRINTDMQQYITYTYFITCYMMWNFSSQINLSLKNWKQINFQTKMSLLLFGLPIVLGLKHRLCLSIHHTDTQKSKGKGARELVIHYSDVKWAPRYLNSPVSRLFVQRFVKAGITGHTKALHHWSTIPQYFKSYPVI